jgi:hypothetical protein
MDIQSVKVLIKWLNLSLPISLSFWDKWWFNMVSDPKIFSSNFDFFIYFSFQLNISRIGHHLLKRTLSPHVRGSVKVLIKWLNLPLPLSLNFWDNWWFNTKFQFLTMIESIVWKPIRIVIKKEMRNCNSVLDNLPVFFHCFFLPSFQLPSIPSSFTKILGYQHISF